MLERSVNNVLHYTVLYDPYRDDHVSAACTDWLLEAWERMWFGGVDVIEVEYFIEPEFESDADPGDENDHERGRRGPKQ